MCMCDAYMALCAALRTGYMGWDGLPVKGVALQIGRIVQSALRTVGMTGFSCSRPRQLAVLV